MRTVVTTLVLIVLVAGGAVFFMNRGGAESEIRFRTAEVKRGDLTITINATGTVMPEERVDVGAQVVGPILKLGMDPRGATDPAFKNKHVDYTSPVEEGTLLAQIDPAVY